MNSGVCVMRYAKLCQSFRSGSAVVGVYFINVYPRIVSASLEKLENVVNPPSRPGADRYASPVF